MPRPTPTRTRRGFVRSYDKAVDRLRATVREMNSLALESPEDRHASLLLAAALDYAADYLASLPDREKKP